MDLSVQTVDLAPSGLTIGCLAAAVTIASICAWFLGRGLAPRGPSSRAALAVRMALIARGALATAAVTVVSYPIIVGLLVPGACTYFAPPTIVALAIPIVVLIGGAISRIRGYRWIRTLFVAVLVAVVWLGSVEAAYRIAWESAALELSGRCGVRARQSINYDKQRIVFSDDVRRVGPHFNRAVFTVPAAASRAEVRALLGTPSDEGNEPGIVACLVGIPVESLDQRAFRFMRYLYADGSYSVFVFDTCTDRVVSQTMGAIPSTAFERMLK
jgi:hypothetical protein